MDIYNEVMMDLETLGVSPGCVVLSVGAVKFNLQGNDTWESIFNNHERTITYRLDIKTQMENGAVIDPSTLEWWFSQSPDAQRVFREYPTDTKTALEAFSFWYKKDGTKGKAIWGNGSSFDCVIWDKLYELFGQKPPYPFWVHQDLRTLKRTAEKKIGSIIHKPEFFGIAHNALDDAINQVLHAQNYWRLINGTVGNTGTNSAEQRQADKDPIPPSVG